jgi:methylenetetrahydrofolate reductase (NADPH)
MNRSFREDILDKNRFVITLELVPGAESTGRAVEKVMAIATDALADGRISAVTITDNPGGNPSLSPDVLGKEILELGMDVIVHFTCRDSNRAGIESRALQLAHMGMKNILALNGDYSGTGFGGQGAPVFDLDSVGLMCLLNMLSDRTDGTKNPKGFFIGCAVSPFKSKEGECFAQYYKLCKKVSAGARFVITQLGYDARKFQELLQIQNGLDLGIATLGSVYVLTPRAARIMNSGKVPGAVVTQRLLEVVQEEWKDPGHGRTAAIERSARLGAVLKGLGYRGIHIGGILSSFEMVAQILDRMPQIEGRWKEFVHEFNFPQKAGFYIYDREEETGLSGEIPCPRISRVSRSEKSLFQFMRAVHHFFFSFDAPLESFYARLSSWLDKRPLGHLLMTLTEDPIKKLLLSCQKCGDCGIQHVAFLCPESQCPKHIRNGACGGSKEGMCEVYPDRPCVWVRAYNRWASIDQAEGMARGCVPPRMWELNNTSAWLNFHLRRDHQSASCGIARHCSVPVCSLQTNPVKTSGTPLKTFFNFLD